MNNFFQCILCKKFKNNKHKNSQFKDGTWMCNSCAEEIINSFTYYIDGKEVTEKEFKEKTDNGKTEGKE